MTYINLQFFYIHCIYQKSKSSSKFLNYITTILNTYKEKHLINKLKYHCWKSETKYIGSHKLRAFHMKSHCESFIKGQIYVISR